jgi:hypothetical protein
MHGEIFFPLPSLDFSIDFAVKAICWRITFLHMEKGPLPRMEGLSSLETSKKSFREWKKLSRITNKFLQAWSWKFTTTF